MDARRSLLTLPLADFPSPANWDSGRLMVADAAHTGHRIGEVARDGSSQQRQPVRRQGVDESDFHALQGLVIQLRNVLFDDSAWRRWLLRLVHHMGLHTHYEAFFRLWEAEYARAVSEDRIGYWPALREFLAEAGMTRGQIDEVEAAGRFRRESLNRQTRPFPAVSGTLARLHSAGMRLVALDTGGGELPDPVQPLRDGNLERWFQAIVTVEPGRERGETCRQALARLHLPLDRVALVGQDPAELDREAGLGLRTIAFNAHRQARAHVYLSNFAELAPLCGVAAVRRRAG